MHELSVVFHVAKMVENIAKENNVKHVKRVVLEVGEVSLIVHADLQDCWKWNAKKSEVLNNCELVIEPIKAITLCESCGKTYSTVEFAKVCPYCKSMNTHLVQGKEINLKEIAVLDEN